MNFLFFEIRTPFFDSILRTAPGTVLKHSHNCARVICGEKHILMHGIFGAPQAASWGQKSDFSKILKISTKCKKIEFFVFQDFRAVFAHNTQECPRNHSRPLPQLSSCYFWRKSHFDARDFVCASSQPPPQVKILKF